MNFWSSELLATFLKCIGLSANNLKISEMSRFSDNILMVVFKPIKGVEIFGLSEYSSQTKSLPPPSSLLFYVMVPGFAIEEFITYLEVLRTQKISIRLPTPFIFLPFLTYIVQTEKEDEYISSLGEGGSIKAYTEKEVDEAINSLEKEAIIKSIY